MPISTQSCAQKQIQEAKTDQWEGYESADGWQMMFSEYGSSNTIIYMVRMYTYQNSTHPTNIYAFKTMHLPSQTHILPALSHLKLKNIRQINSEITALSALQFSPRIIKLFQVIQDHPSNVENHKFIHNFLRRNQPYVSGFTSLILQYCHEGSLQKWLGSKDQVKEDQIQDIIRQMVEGLLALRAKKIVHRDLSVSNILICPTGIKICDFDTAFIAGFSSQQDISITFNKYKMAPQLNILVNKDPNQLQKMSSEELYEKQKNCDIFGLGTVIFELITKNSYCSVQDSFQEIQNSNYSSKMKYLVKAMLQKQPSRRVNLEFLADQYSCQYHPRNLDCSTKLFDLINENISEVDNLDQKSEKTSFSFSLDDESQDICSNKLISWEQNRVKKKYYTREQMIDHQDFF